MELKKPLFFIIGVFFFIKLLFLLKYHLPIWDEAVYLGIGKALYSFGASGIWEPLRPIGLSMVIGLLWKLNISYIKGAEIIALIFAAGNIILTYLIAEKTFNKKVAVISALLVATFPIFFLYSSYILTEIPATFFALLALYCYLRNKLIGAGLSAGISTLFKFTQGIIVLAFVIVFLYEFLRERKTREVIGRGFGFMASFFAAVLPFLALNYILYRKYTSNITDAVFRPFIMASWHQFNPAESIQITGLSSFLANWLFYLIVMLKENFLMLFFLIGIIIALFRLDNKKFVIVSILLVFFAYFTFISNKQERFFLLFLPFAAIFAAYALYILMTKFASPVVFGIIMFLVLFSGLFVAAKDINFYSWRVFEKPSAVEGLYSQIDKNNFQEPIFTSDPVFAAYTDKRLVPYYFSVQEGLQIVSSSKEEGTIIFSPRSFYCADNDWQCQDDREKLFARINSSALLFSGRFYGEQDYYIYKKK